MVKLKLFNKNAQGMTLVEVLVSLTILSVGILTVFGMLTQAVRINASNRGKIVATNLAQQVMEERMGEMLPSPTSSYVSGSVYGFPNGDYTVDGRRYFHYSKVNYGAVGTVNTLAYAEIEVAVRWTDSNMQREVVQRTKVIAP